MSISYISINSRRFLEILICIIFIVLIIINIFQYFLNKNVISKMEDIFYKKKTKSDDSEKERSDIFEDKLEYEITVGNVTRNLPLRTIGDNVKIAVLDVLGDWELNEAIGRSLAMKIPPGIQVLVMPDGKAQAIIHVIGRITGLPTVIARKEIKSYMKTPILHEKYRSITTLKEQTLYFDEVSSSRVNGKVCGIVDDIISTGETLEAMKKLIEKAGGTVGSIICAYTEGEQDENYISLGSLPVVKEDTN